MKQTVLCIFLVSMVTGMLAANLPAVPIESVQELPRQPDDVRSFNPFEQVEAETYNYQSGIELLECHDEDGGLEVASMYDGDILGYADAVFTSGSATRIEVRLTAVFAVGHTVNMNVHLDNATGPTIASVAVTDTSNEWYTLSSPLFVEPPTSSHNLFFTFQTNDQENYYWAINWFQFKQN